MQDIQGIDEEVMKAGEEAKASGQLTPLIKVELWSKIQSRRLSEGKEELNVQFSPPTATPLTEEEEEKSRRRKECNREAAHRCRQRRKERQKDKDKELELLKARNEDLKRQTEHLEQQIEVYKGLLSVETLGNPASPEQEVPGHWSGHDFLDYSI
ncbi:cyclic AMP-dependent transcription factor ATF-3-like [Saccostrea echinata]|uniref:cyclic AMP-dependent transcription factor ATF-3-like n=1 Tax=Saccostrea echinata TaxID=191078 RepID=UPI002A803F37|nr:cyclic AMP-dependent transcription factor ATF-3-like [Saccostrea echinata]XP_061174297.1 cyclic AMP-dependent transcription factor ATF-3-like [Saccostrea echinata]